MDIQLVVVKGYFLDQEVVYKIIVEQSENIYLVAFIFWKGCEMYVL